MHYLTVRKGQSNQMIREVSNAVLFSTASRRLSSPFGYDPRGLEGGRGMHKKIEGVGTAWDWWVRLRDFLDALGIRGVLQGIAMLALATIWHFLLRAFSTLPLWANVGLALVFAVLLMHLWVMVRRAWSLRGLKTVDFKEVGAECLAFQADVFEFLSNRQDSAPMREGIPRGSAQEIGDAMHNQWARNTLRSQQTGIRIHQKFAHRALALNTQLKNLGISQADLWAFDHSIGGVAAYYGAVGELLKAGLLTEARGVDPRVARSFHIFVS
jgi:hypothetical protein